MTAPASSLAVCALLAASSLKAALIVCGAWASARVAARRSAAVRHHIWTLALLGTLILPVLQYAMPAWGVARSGRAARFLEAALSIPSTSAATTTNAVLEPPHVIRWTACIVAIWLVGVGFMLARLLHGLLFLTRTSSRCEKSLQITVERCSQKLGLRRSVKILIACDSRAVPCTWGVLRPRILLPSTALAWPHHRMEMVLSHELAHVHRFDWPVRLAAECARALFWFHPLVWLSAARLCEESERACDDAVLASGTNANSYAAELLDLVSHARNSPAAALAVARSSHFERRFTSMLDPNINRRRLTGKAALFSTVATLLCLVPLASVRAPAQDATGVFSGSVVDPLGAPVPNATVAMTNTQTHAIRMTATDSAGNYRFESLPAGDYERSVYKEGFSDFGSSQSVNPGASSSAPATTLSQGTAAPAPAPDVSRLSVGGNVIGSNLIEQTPPIYPAEAKAARSQGSVVLKAIIDKEGRLSSLRVVNSQIDPALARAAIEAVSQWRYKPTLLNGEPTNIATNIQVNFTLAQ